MLRPGPEWAAFGLAYAGCVARVRHRRSEGGARVEVFLPKVDASDSDIDLDERWYLSLWLAPAPHWAAVAIVIGAPISREMAAAISSLRSV